MEAQQVAAGHGDSQRAELSPAGSEPRVTTWQGSLRVWRSFQMLSHVSALGAQPLSCPGNARTLTRSHGGLSPVLYV